MKFAACIVLVAAVSASAQSLDLLGIAPGLNFSKAFGLSPDGRIATGYSSAPNVARAYLWTRENGRVDWGLDPDVPPSTVGYGVTNDGLIVGQASSPTMMSRAFRYRGPGTFELLGVPPGFDRSYARGVSGDGEVVIGYAEVGVQTPFQAGFRWTQASGMQVVGPPGFGFAGGVSRDGSTVVGAVLGGPNFTEFAYRWTEAEGTQFLPDYPGSDTGSSALAVNFDGSIIVGKSGERYSAVIWRGGEIFQLPIPAGEARITPTAVNDDGTVVACGGWIWTSGAGTEMFPDYLRRHGVSVPVGMSLTINAISANGLVFAGVTGGVGHSGEGFVATVPVPTSSAVLAVVGVASVRRRRASSV